MWMIYLYLTVAGLGIVSMPSFGVWFKHNYVFHNYKLRRRQDEDETRHFVESADWWKLNLEGKRKQHHDLWALPPALFIALLCWPAFFAVLIAFNTIKYGSRALAIPGEIMVKLDRHKKEHQKYMAEANHEVEKLLTSTHE